MEKNKEKKQIIGTYQNLTITLCYWLEWSLTLLETNLTFPEASATAVSAMTSALMEPRPPVALVLIKLSSTTSSRSVICKQSVTSVIEVFPQKNMDFLCFLLNIYPILFFFKTFIFL